MDQAKAAAALAKPIEAVLLAPWRYQNIWLIPKLDGWRIYNAASETYLGVGFPAMYWDAKHATAFATPEAAMKDLAFAQMSPRLVNGFDWVRRNPEDLRGAISIEAIASAKIAAWKTSEKIAAPGWRGRILSLLASLQKWLMRGNPND